MSERKSNKLSINLTITLLDIYDSPWLTLLVRMSLLRSTRSNLVDEHLRPADKNPERVAAGLKAAVHNPNVSEEAKERAIDRLESMGEETYIGNASDGHETNRVLGGYKATMAVCRTHAICGPMAR